MFRVGVGYDIHKLVEGRRLVIGGVEIPYEKGLLGHSDADVLLHAISDALLGAASLGDIGTHFPDTDPRFKDIPSSHILERVYEMIADRFEIRNVDSVVIAERPKLAPYIDRMRANIAELLRIDPGRVSVKAKTNEG
ncbi:2-C-methyl-D-erythritol 2,4-cyclodiphosphate synthase, partial [Candidatus Poribacteria bacterium]